MDNKTIKDNIARVREAKFLTQDMVADRLGISRNSYRRIEKGQTSLINDRLFEIADILEVDVMELILGEDYSSEPVQTGLEDPACYYEGKMREQEEAMMSERAATAEKIAYLEQHVANLEKWLHDKDEIIDLMKRHP